MSPLTGGVLLLLLQGALLTQAQQCDGGQCVCLSVCLFFITPNQLDVPCLSLANPS